LLRGVLFFSPPVAERLLLALEALALLPLPAACARTDFPGEDEDLDDEALEGEEEELRDAIDCSLGGE
jgi:hypothetical protein